MRGSKTLTVKDRVTLVFCVTATGEKVPPLLVGTSKEPVCFRDKLKDEKLIPYINQKSAWVDRTIYRHWWFNVFLPFVRDHAPNGEPVALILDNCSGHDPDLDDPLGQVIKKIIF